MSLDRRKLKILYANVMNDNGACFAESIKKAGVDVVPLATEKYSNWGGSFLSRVQRRLNAGPGIRAFNRDILKLVEKEKPDAVWVVKGTMLKPETIERARKTYPCVWAHENPDDPFGPRKGHYGWKVFVSAIPAYDLHFVHRDVDVADYTAAGARRVERINFTFFPELHAPPPEGEEPDFECDVTFIGRWEAERDDAIRLLSKTGLKIRVWGPFWPDKMNEAPPGVQVMGEGVFGNAYAEAWWKTKVGLNILTRFNRDVHTIRSLEIPACGCAQLCERTSEHAAFLKEGEEAEFFSTWGEMADKAREMASNPERCRQMGRLAAERVRRDKLDAVSRVSAQLKNIAELAL